MKLFKKFAEEKERNRGLQREKMKTTLVIMAAGIGSRFGGGIKQLAPVGLNGEIIMDYSIHDAIEAGFNKIVFIMERLSQALLPQRSGLQQNSFYYP